MLTRITTTNELDILSRVDQSVFDILNDNEIGRAKVVLRLADKGFLVSEKVVRNWREGVALAYTDKTELGKLRSEQAKHANKVWVETPTVIAAKPSAYYDLTPIWDKPHTGVINTTTTTTSVGAVSKAKPKAKTIVVMPDVQAPLRKLSSLVSSRITSLLSLRRLVTSRIPLRSAVGCAGRSPSMLETFRMV